jgi:hypothetical protein
MTILIGRAYLARKAEMLLKLAAIPKLRFLIDRALIERRSLMRWARRQIEPIDAREKCSA